MAAQADVCVFSIEVGEQVTATDVIVDDVVTWTLADPDLVVSWVDVATIVAVPVLVGVKTPVLLIDPVLTAGVDPRPAGFSDQVTAEL